MQRGKIQEDPPVLVKIAVSPADKVTGWGISHGDAKQHGSMSLELKRTHIGIFSPERNWMLTAGGISWYADQGGQTAGGWGGLLIEVIKTFCSSTERSIAEPV